MLALVELIALLDSGVVLEDVGVVVTGTLGVVATVVLGLTPASVQYCWD